METCQYHGSPASGKCSCYAGLGQVQNQADAVVLPPQPLQQESVIPLCEQPKNYLHIFKYL